MQQITHNGKIYTLNNQAECDNCPIDGIAYYAKATAEDGDTITIKWQLSDEYLTEFEFYREYINGDGDPCDCPCESYACDWEKYEVI